MLQAFLCVPTKMTLNITVINGSIFYIFVIFMGCWALKVDRVGQGKGSAVSVGWAAPVSSGIVSIGVERKIKRHEFF